MDTKAIEELIAIMDKAELTALRVDDGETKIELERNHGPLSSTALPLMADRVSALLAGKTESHEAAAVEDADESSILVRSPMVGMFYISPSPDEDPFVKVGQEVLSGQTLAIVEAMKMMNEITTPAPGIVVEVLPPPPAKRTRAARAMFDKILIANRGEIAVRIIRACRAMDIKTVAVYSTADKHSLHVYLADESVCIGPPAARDSYLNIAAILSAAKGTGAQAIHPGYGFLSENSTFAKLCRENDIVFIGPAPEVLDRMGNKSQARKTMMEAGVPVVPGTKEPVHHPEEALAMAREIGWPIMIKASSGGGGKGMRISHDEHDFSEQFSIAQRESVGAFGDNTMYLERCVLSPRHVEVQIIADTYGTVVALGERDCSVQRNHQKMIEESPSPVMTERVRDEMLEAAVRAAQAVGYTSAGTIEFLLDDKLNYYFMEMNTRIQVEHPVTEMVTGTDLVEEMIRVAAGDPLTFTQDDITYRGHAIECRVNAEQPERGFLPSPGTISQMHLPGGNGVRVDTAAYDGYEITPYYDSMIAKVIVHGRDRTEAIAKMRTALEEMVVVGVKTNLDFQYAIMENETFAAGHADTSFIERFMKGEV